MKIPPQNGGSTHPFLGAKIRLRHLRTAAARKQEEIPGKLQHGITSVSKLPSHLRLVNFGSGAFEL